MRSPDQFHLNDTSYDCLGKLLAESLRGAANTTTTVEPALAGKRLQQTKKERPESLSLVCAILQ